MTRLRQMKDFTAGLSSVVFTTNHVTPNLFMMEPNKTAFLKMWPGGYRENFDVYERVTGGKENDIVARCIEPFAKADGIALEIGCGSGFWVERHLLPRFKQVIGLDLIPPEWVCVSSERFKYIEVPSRNYDCFTIANDSIDFVWSFGCFCHIPMEAIAKYLDSIIRVLRPGAKAALFFSDTKRREGTAPREGYDPNFDPNYDPDTHVIWCDNDWNRTSALMVARGFKNVRDLMPHHKDTLAYGEKST